MRLKTFFTDYSNRVAVILAVGLFLFIAHYENQPLLQYVFLPQIGMVMLLGTVLYLIFNQWNDIKKIGLGDKYIWIPLAVISGSAVLRLFIQQDMHTLASAFFMASMFGLYIVARKYGEKALSFFMLITIIGAVYVIVQFLIVRAGENSGLFNNYATASQFLVFGWLVSPRRHQWWMSAIVLAGVFCTGAEESVLYIAIIGIVILARRDWSKKILLPVGIFALLFLVGLPLHMPQVLYGRGFNMVVAAHQAITDDSLTPEEKDALLDQALHARWMHGWRIQRDIRPLGYGLELTYHSTVTPHNIILLVTDQLGPVAACAWVGAMIVGIRKTKWKYGFLALILFGVFQPFVWTEMAPYMWCMAGAATVSGRSSYIFKEGYGTTEG